MSEATIESTTMKNTCPWPKNNMLPNKKKNKKNSDPNKISSNIL